MIPRRSWATTWTLRYSPAKCAWCRTVSTGAQSACGWNCEDALLTVSIALLQHLRSGHVSRVCVGSFFCASREKHRNLAGSISQVGRRVFSSGGKNWLQKGRKAAGQVPLWLSEMIDIGSCVLHALKSTCPAARTPTLPENVAKALFSLLRDVCLFCVCVCAHEFRSSALARQRNDLIKFSTCSSQHFMPSRNTHHVWRSLQRATEGAEHEVELKMYSLSFYCVWVFERATRLQKGSSRKHFFTIIFPDLGKQVFEQLLLHLSLI